MFIGLTRDICAQAWDIVLPAVERAATSGTSAGFQGTIIVLRTDAVPTDLAAPGETIDVDGSMGAVLFTADIGTPPDDPFYRRMALGKAHTALATGLPSRVAQQQAPHLLKPGMTPWGGAVVRDGLVVAFSGVEIAFDEMIAAWTAEAIIAICRHEVSRDGGPIASKQRFLGV